MLNSAVRDVRPVIVSKRPKMEALIKESVPKWPPEDFVSELKDDSLPELHVLGDHRYVGYNARYFRHLLELSQHDVAVRSNGCFEQRHVSAMERGWMPHDPEGFFKALANAIGVTYEMLLRRPRVVTSLNNVRAIVYRPLREKP